MQLLPGKSVHLTFCPRPFVQTAGAIGTSILLRTFIGAVTGAIVLNLLLLVGHNAGLTLPGGYRLRRLKACRAIATRLHS